MLGRFLNRNAIIEMQSANRLGCQNFQAQINLNLYNSRGHPSSNVSDSKINGKTGSARSNSRLRALLRIAALLLLVFLGLQFVRPELTNPPVTADLQAPPEVKQILRNSCYNCHSNETKIPWFDQIVPAYWLVVSDVNEARMHLNFSTIGAEPPGRRKAILFEAIHQIQLGAMPLPSYQFVHPGSTVTPEQLAVLRAYLNPPKAAAAHEADAAAVENLRP
jgi:hypothetical protein